MTFPIPEVPEVSRARAAVETLFGAPATPARSRLLVAHYPQLGGLDEAAWQTLIEEVAAVQDMAADGWDLDAVARLSAAIHRFGIGDDVCRLVADVIAFNTEETQR